VLADQGMKLHNELNGVRKRNCKTTCNSAPYIRVTAAKDVEHMATAFQQDARMAMNTGSSYSGPLSMLPSQFGMFTKCTTLKFMRHLIWNTMFSPVHRQDWGDPLHAYIRRSPVSVCNLAPESLGNPVTSHILTATTHPEFR